MTLATPCSLNSEACAAAASASAPTSAASDRCIRASDSSVLDMPCSPKLGTASSVRADSPSSIRSTLSSCRAAEAAPRASLGPGSRVVPSILPSCIHIVARWMCDNLAPWSSKMRTSSPTSAAVEIVDVISFGRVPIDWRLWAPPLGFRRASDSPSAAVAEPAFEPGPRRRRWLFGGLRLRAGCASRRRAVAPTTACAGSRSACAGLAAGASSTAASGRSARSAPAARRRNASKTP